MKTTGYFWRILLCLLPLLPDLSIILIEVRVFYDYMWLLLGFCSSKVNKDGYQQQTVKS